MEGVKLATEENMTKMCEVDCLAPCWSQDCKWLSLEERLINDGSDYIWVRYCQHPQAECDDRGLLRQCPGWESPWEENNGS